jgi:hypothetical protein
MYTRNFCFVFVSLRFCVDLVTLQLQLFALPASLCTFDPAFRAAGTFGNVGTFDRLSNPIPIKEEGQNQFTLFVYNNMTNLFRNILEPTVTVLPELPHQTGLSSSELFDIPTPLACRDFAPSGLHTC